MKDPAKPSCEKDSAEPGFVEIDKNTQVLHVLFIMMNWKTKFDGIFLFDWYTG